MDVMPNLEHQVLIRAQKESLIEAMPVNSFSHEGSKGRGGLFARIDSSRRSGSTCSRQVGAGFRGIMISKWGMMEIMLKGW